MIYKQLNKLSTKELHELHEALTTAGIMHQLGNNWRNVFRVKKHKYKLGYKHRLYSMLELMDECSLIEAEKSITGEQ